jgi:hypothetical protein
VRRRRTASVLLLAGMVLATALPGGVVPQVAAAEYELETSAVYDARPDDGEVGVTVQITFTNTTPNPAGRFSLFEEIELAVHDAATDVTASDEDGDLDVELARSDDDVNVATIQLRDELRFEESADLELRYTLGDSEDPQLRVRPAVIVFPAWGFGTASEVSVIIPSGYEVRIDGDPLTESDGRLVSGAIDAPADWLALVTASRPTEYTTFESTVPLAGGTADLEVRAFADDEAWGERTLDLVERALPLLETAIGLPYPRVGRLVLIESVASDASGFAETANAGAEILVAFDQPSFTAIHQVAHVWLSPELIDARWIREGMASEMAARAARELEVDLPYDPAEETEARAEAAFPLDSWGASQDPAAEGYGHAASWAFISGLVASVGPETLQTVLGRAASSVSPYAETEIDPEPPEDGATPQVALTSRSFLDHLETVDDGDDLAEQFGERVFAADDVDLLPARAEARSAFEDLVAGSGGWGAPDQVRVAMEAWSFDDARDQMADAASWLEARDVLLREMEAVGLSAPDRLQQAYRSFGGGPEAQAELDAERAVVETYAATSVDVNGPRSLFERVGLVGGPDPAEQLALASGRFAEGDLRGAVEAVGEAQRILTAAESGGMLRLASAVVVALILVALAVLLFRRRAAYTSAP